VNKPALGIPIIIVTIFLFMTGYVHFVVSGASQPETLEAPPGSPAVMQAPSAADPGQGPAENDSSGLAQSATPANKDVKSWTGRFAGYVDSNLVVIYVGDEVKTFYTPPGVNGTGLARGDNVSFEFSLDNNGQPVLSTITKLVPSE
jgi:hypothetical protein